MKNRVVHFEIHANDAKRAIEFYKQVFGWKMEQWGDQQYWMVMTAPQDSPDKGINGGLLIREGKIPVESQSVNAFVCTVQVENIDAIIKKIEKAGGKVRSPKFAFPGMAWQAYYTDTEGNIFGIHQADKDAK